MPFDAYFSGFSIGLSLILAIGAQNAFVLRQGLRGEHLLAVVLVCALSDALLILFGVGGFQQILRRAPWIDPIMRYGGALFLIVYAVKSLLSALRTQHGLSAANTAPASLGKTVLTCLALTWLNPHVYLDTVVLLGTVSTRFAPAQYVFAFGAMTASFAFFFSLGYGATLLRPLFANPKAWRVIELLIALMMGWLAIRLIGGF